MLCVDAGKDDKYVKLLQEVSRRTGKLVALWQSIGFVHGVLNTDNMSILGETIDYGCVLLLASCQSVLLFQESHVLRKT